MITNYEKLKALLRDLFQMDQADLDFGLYRIMNAKRDEIEKFLETDLLPQVKAELARHTNLDSGAKKAELDETIENAKRLGVNPDTVPKVLELRDELKKGGDLDALENEVFSHLYNFFRRYYHEGDFLSLRRYKEGVYAIPYEGEEVKLYWANHDQYYIKSTEYLRNYTFKLRDNRRVHFKVVEADSEADNNKPQNGKERRFILVETDAVAVENGELFIRFNYHADTRKQAELNTAAVTAVLGNATLTDWLSALGELRPTEKNPGRTLLAKHLDDFTARYAFDYFIHKDLGGFFRRELDFFIKNEIMHLDDVEDDTAPKVELYLSKIKALRKIAHKVIALVEQLETFQKKLWLKKKFVVETNYCVTLDRVPEELYPEIIENKAQIEEWKQLFAIQKIERDTTQPGFSEPVTIDFIKSQRSLVIDTRFFNSTFVQRLLASFGDVEDSLQGIAVCSENSQALRLLMRRYAEGVGCIYIDPPYNTGGNDFAYKDNYQHSSWLSMMRERVMLGRALLKPDGVFFCSIGEDEQSNLKTILDTVFRAENSLGTIVWKARVKPVNIGDSKYRPQKEIEYVQAYEAEKGRAVFRPLLTGSVRNYPNLLGERKYRLATILKSNRGVNYRSTMSFEIAGYTPPEGQRWQAGEDVIRQLHQDGYIEFRDGTPFRRYFEDEEGAEHDPFYCFMESDWSGTSEVGKSELNNILGNMHGFDTVKPTRLVRTLTASCSSQSEVFLDFYGGSGTTGHAIMSANHDDSGKRKFVMVEVADYFDGLLLRRLKKVMHSKDWQNGEPISREGMSVVMKYIRLESYEDCLNNLELKRTKAQDDLLTQAQEFREDYTLRYMLDVETRGSASLLNIQKFTDPFSYKLKVSTGTVGETKEVNVDLVETFNWLIGLKVKHIDHIRNVRVVEGTNPQGDRVLILWRNVAEVPNDKLDEWFKTQGYNTRDQEYDLIYVNGDNNLENLRRGDQTWKVRLIEEDFHRLMWECQDV